jgi:hypothetical protein
MAHACCAQGKNDEAESCCKLAISILEKAPPGADPVSFVKALEEYAKVLRNTNRGVQAEKVEARANTLRDGGAKPQGEGGERLVLTLR